MNKSTYAASANLPESPKRYATDVTDYEWSIVAPEVERYAGSGRKRSVDLREVLNALFYLDRTGCQWRMIPKDFPNHNTVYYYFKKWRDDGTLMRLNDLLRRQIRVTIGKDPEPSLGIIDSQSVKTTEAGGDRGYDGAKQVTGRKRHIMVDTLGLLLILMVHMASIPDEEGAQPVLTRAERTLPRLQKVIGDGAYKRNGLVAWVSVLCRFVLEIVTRDPKRKGFYVLPKRWIVERTFAWLGRNRRLSKDYETLEESSEGVVYIASIRYMLRRLDRAKTS